VRQGLSFRELRDLYARSRFVVVPILDVEFNAGLTAVSEAMAMGKALIVTRTRGQVDYIENGVHGLYVPPDDPTAMHAAITYLLNHPEEAERMGRAGRALIEEQHTLDGFVERVATLLREGEDYAGVPTRADRRLLGMKGEQL
jgi:glycosyltransferase involved in cell wall biosynthesis